MRPGNLSFLLMSLAALCLLAPASAVAGKRPGKGRKAKSQVEEPVTEEKPPSMFEHVSTTDFIGDLKVERYALSTNGLSVLLIPDPSSETIAYHTYFDVGSGDEVPGKTGLAHLFEHMMFKRTEKYDDQHFSRTIEEAGGPDLNAWTWLDMTAYHVSLPKTQLGLILELESTRMQQLVIDEAQLDSEREVVQNERRFRVDNNPESAMNEQLWSLAFEKTRYHWPTIGWAEDIAGYTVEDCMEFYRAWYAPNNATIVLVGGFEVEDALQQIEAAYGGIPASELTRLEHGDEPEQTEARRLDMELEMQAEVLLLGYKVPSLVHEDTAALALLDSILSSGESSRLQRRLVDTGWAASASGWLPPFQNEALYEFSVTMRESKSAEAALAIVQAELEDLKANPVSDEELGRALAQLLASQYGQLLSNSGRAGFVGFWEVAAGDWQRGLSDLDAYRAVTAEDVQRVAQTYFDSARSSTVVGRPKGSKLKTFREKDLPKIPAVSAEALPSVIGRPDEGPPPYELGQIHERETMGWTRLMVYDPSLPMTWFRIVIPFGSGMEPADKRGLANVTASMVLRGSQDRDRDTFERTLEGLGASVSADVDADTVTISGSALSENWPQVAALLSEAFEFPAFDEEELDGLIEELKAEIVDDRNSDRQLARKFYAQGLFGEHRYGQPVIGTLSSLDEITGDDVRSFYRSWFTSRGAILALLGDFDAGAGGDLARLAGNLIGTPDPVVPELAPPVPSGRKVWLVDKPERSQVQVFLGHFFLRPDDPDYPEAWLGNEAFAGWGFGARLMQEVREKRGWSYGAYAFPVHLKDLSTYTLWVFPATKDAIPCLQLVDSLYKDFVAEGLSEAELSYARGSIVNSAAFFRDTPAKRLEYEVQRRLTGYAPLDLIPAVSAATLDEVNQATASSYHPEDLFVVIVGTADSKVELGEGEQARELTLLQALQELYGEDSVELVPFDRD